MRRQNSDSFLARNLLSLVRSEAAPDSPGVAFGKGFSEAWCPNRAGIADPTADRGLLGCR